MSNFNIALVAEGKTDSCVIDAALKNILKGHAFTLTLLQPETSDTFGGAGNFGGGWSGVYKWCKSYTEMNFTLNFDVVIIHIDADVASCRYSDAGISCESADLPCIMPCPPSSDTVNRLKNVILKWLGINDEIEMPHKWVLCIPSYSTETWIFTAKYYEKCPLLMPEIECCTEIEDRLSGMSPRDGKFIRNGRKQFSQYRSYQSELTARWEIVCRFCSQASCFSEAVSNLLC